MFPKIPHTDLLRKKFVNCIEYKISKNDKSKKFKLILKNTAQNREKYLYYFNQYKKVVSSVLYLDIARNIKRMTYKHVVAAWTAFFIAAINSYIAIYIFKAYAANTILFIIAMALLYVFKDRAKNIFKLIVGAKTLSRFPDSYTTIKDDLGKKTINLGEIREKVFFPVDNQISQTVLDLRKKTSVLSKNILDKILVYQKEINVKTSIIKKYYDRTTNLTDIMRFNLDKFLANMGDPKKLIYYYDQGANSLEASEGARVYNLGLIIKYTKLAKRKKKILHYEYYNIVCTKFGIKRVEFIERI